MAKVGKSLPPTIAEKNRLEIKINCEKIIEFSFSSNTIKIAFTRKLSQKNKSVVSKSERKAIFYKKLKHQMECFLNDFYKTEKSLGEIPSELLGKTNKFLNNC